jgi:hypothetical protein
MRNAEAIDFRHAEKVHIELSLRIRRVRIFDRSGDPETGAVDHQIQMAFLFDHRFDGRPYVFRLRDIAVDVSDVSFVFSGTGKVIDLPSASRQPFCSTVSDPGTPSCYDRNFPHDTSIISVPVSVMTFPQDHINIDGIKKTILPDHSPTKILSHKKI